MDNNKQDFINNYLEQQASNIEGGTGGVLQPIAVPNNEALEEFKTKVRAWMEIDNTIKKLRAIIRERNHAKKELTEYILTFMSKFNIEDLNTKEGKLRYKVTTVKAPLTQQVMKSRLITNFTSDIHPDELAKLVFDTRNTVEKHSLKRLKPPKSLTI